MPTAEEFREQLFEVFRVAAERRQLFVTVKAGDLHRKVGGYPGRRSQRMPVCCSVMRGAMLEDDVVVSEPPKGAGATLTIRYCIPRPNRGGTR